MHFIGLNTSLLSLFLLLHPGIFSQAQPATIIDSSHYSNTFGEIRNYRIFLPAGYNKTNRKYPVIYFLHGWGQRYFGEGAYRYAAYDSAKDNSGDNIGNYVASHNVIVVKADGYNPTAAEPNYPRPYNIGPVETYRQFPLYIHELITYIDQHYRSIADRGHRAISGLSMGGFMSFWIAAKYPDLFCAAGNFCGSPEFFVGPVGFPVEYRQLDMYKNFEGVRLRLHYGDKDFIRQYHEETNEAWSHLMDNYQWKMFPAEHSACGMGEMFDFLLASFAHPLPRPRGWTHADVYPDFNVWGYNVSSDRSAPGFTVLENVSGKGFRSTVREFVPDGRILSNVMLSVITDSLYKKNAQYRITDIDHHSGKIKQYMAISDNRGRLQISFSGSRHDIGISEQMDEPDLVMDSVIIVNQPWLIAGEDIHLRIRLLNRGRGVAHDIRLKIEATRGDTKIVNGSASFADILPGRGGENNIPLIIRTTDPTRASRLNVSLVSGKRRWFTDITLFLKRPTDSTLTNWVIADGQIFKVVNGGNDSVTMRLGSGNGDGKPDPGETIMILALDSGKLYRTALTPGPCLNIPEMRIRKSDYWGKFDNVGASQKFDQLQITKACPGDSTIPVLFEYWKPEGTRHIVRQGIARVRISGGDEMSPATK